MLNSSNVPKLVRAFCVVSAVLSVLLYLFIQGRMDPEVELWRLVSLTSLVSGALVLIFLSGWFTRKVWQFGSWLSSSIYPNLHGTWEGAITPYTGGAPGAPLAFQAVVRQTIYSTELDFSGDGFLSTTISATPRSIHGQHHLTYVYRVTPENPAYHEYTGTARLVVARRSLGDSPSISMTGTYVTDRRTIGQIELRRARPKPKRARRAGAEAVVTRSG